MVEIENILIKIVSELLVLGKITAINLVKSMMGIILIKNIINISKFCLKIITPSIDYNILKL